MEAARFLSFASAETANCCVGGATDGFRWRRQRAETSRSRAAPYVCAKKKKKLVAQLAPVGYDFCARYFYFVAQFSAPSKPNPLFSDEYVSCALNLLNCEDKFVELAKSVAGKPSAALWSRWSRASERRCSRKAF